jgi:predicted RNA-binding Zn ribbon-like protein
VDFTCYADLAVRLVNTAPEIGGEPDWLETADSFRAFAAAQPLLAGPCTHHDLDALRMLRDELTAIFLAAAERDSAAAASRMNALLVQYPIRPTLVRHGRSRWHLHLDDSGSVADRYAAGAITGLATIASEFGLTHLGFCVVPGCRSAFVNANRGRPSRRCACHDASRANVTALPAMPGHRPSANGRASGYPASTAVG